MEPWVWAWLLLVVGLIIIGIEMFVPSGGFLGVLSAMAILGAIVMAFVSSAKFGVFMMVLVSILLPALFAVAVKYWPDTPIGRLIVAKPPTSEEVLPNAESRRNLQSLIGRSGIARCPMLPGGVVQVDGKSYDAVTDGRPVSEGERIQVIAVRMNRLEVRLDDRPESIAAPAYSKNPSQDSADPASAAEPPLLQTQNTSDVAPKTADARAREPDVRTADDLLSRPIESLGLEPLDDPLK